MRDQWYQESKGIGTLAYIIRKDEFLSNKK